MKRENIIEILMLILVIGAIIVAPLTIYYINQYYRVYKFPKGAQVIDLYGIAKGGIWTQERVDSYNYWWKKFKRAEEIPIRGDGTPIFFRVTSSDVVHSFAVPLYRIGPFDVKPGEFAEVELKTEQPLRSTRYLCWQYCDKDHEDMQGRIVVISGEEGNL